MQQPVFKWSRVKGQTFLNLVNPTRSEIDSKPPAALVSIEILSFGDWKCCKAYVFFLSKIMVWVYCSTLSSFFACSFPPWVFCSSHSAAHPTTPYQSRVLSPMWPCFIAQERQGQVRQGNQTPQAKAALEHPTTLEMVWNSSKASPLASQACSIHSLYTLHSPSLTFKCLWPPCEWNPNSRGAWWWNGGMQSWVSLGRDRESSSLKGFSEHSSFDWTNSASKPELTQLHKTASMSPLWLQFTAGQNPSAISPALTAGAHTAADSTALSHNRHLRQTGDILPYKPAEEAQCRWWANSHQI